MEEYEIAQQAKQLLKEEEEPQDWGAWSQTQYPSLATCWTSLQRSPCPEVPDQGARTGGASLRLGVCAAYRRG